MSDDDDLCVCVCPLFFLHGCVIYFWFITSLCVYMYLTGVLRLAPTHLEHHHHHHHHQQAAAAAAAAAADHDSGVCVRVCDVYLFILFGPGKCTYACIREK